MRIYEKMRNMEPDFFIHCGDTINADNPVPSQILLPDGTVWRNITTEEKSKVAETIDEFRGNFLYDLMDENVRPFNSSVPKIWQGDDHEFMNNWSPGVNLQDRPEYRIKDIRMLAAHARQAFLEYGPLRFDPRLSRIYRRISYGPLLDVFVLDMRIYPRRERFQSSNRGILKTVYFGAEQFALS